jgi:uncharacterized protein YndB with AHSA1/START domain
VYGTLGSAADGRPTLRFERGYAHPPAKVWRAITERDQLRHWFVQVLDYDRMEFDPAPGAAVVFTPQAEYAALGVGRGTVTAYDPPRLLEYTWDNETLRWELEPDGTGCRLVFTNTFDDREAASGLDAGWQAGLDLLADLLERPA